MNGKIIIYQVLPRLFGNGKMGHHPRGTLAQNGSGHMADFTRRALDEIRALGVTHVWFTGLIEHATKTRYDRYGIRPDHPAIVKGEAGSPYAIKDYYDIDPDLAVEVKNRMKEFEKLVNRTHNAGLGLVMDFVPNHVSRQYNSDAKPAGTKDLGVGDDETVAFSPNNNFYYIPREWLCAQFDLQGYVERPARATGNDVFHAWLAATDWYETVKLNYGVDYQNGRTPHFDPIPDTWHKMLDILLFWADKGADAFRCDMAEMVPVEFWQWVIPAVKKRFPQILFIAEVYNPSLYRDYLSRGHFDYLYDKVGLYDKLRAIVRGEASTQELTACWQQVNDIRGHMLYFLENHDEQRLASDFYAGDATKGRPALLVAALMSSNPFMLYFGQELGERGMDEEGFSGRDGRTSIFDYWSINSIKRWRRGGHYDYQELTEGEQALRDYYKKVLNLSLQDETLSKGESYDLMFANPDLHRQYAFIRRLKDKGVIVVANFSDRDEEIQLNLPAHLFEFYKWTETSGISATDLLTGETYQLNFTAADPMKLVLPSLGGMVLEFSLETPKEKKSKGKKK